MFFIGCERGRQIGVVDTDDFAIDFFIPQELSDVDVNIVGYDRISLDYLIQHPQNLMHANEYIKFKNNSVSVLYKSLLKNETDMITEHYVVGLHDVLYFENKCTTVGVVKCFSYVENYGMFILVLKVSDGKSDTFALCRVMSDGTIVTKVLNFETQWSLGSNPIGSGYMYSKYFSNIPQDKIFLKVNYTNTNFVLFEIGAFTPSFRK